MRHENDFRQRARKEKRAERQVIRPFNATTHRRNGSIFEIPAWLSFNDMEDASMNVDRRWFSGIAVLDRKSTRLNSSHPSISYAVFCLKKKKKKIRNHK